MKCPKCGEETEVLSVARNARKRKCLGCGFVGKTLESWSGDAVARPAVRVVGHKAARNSYGRTDAFPETPGGMTREDALKEVRGY